MSLHLISRRLPCGHGHFRLAVHGNFRRRCSTCRRAWLGRVVPSEASSLVGREVWKVEWEEVGR